MPYIKGESRGQLTLLPESLEDYVTEDNPVRVIDAFVDGLDIKSMGFTKHTPSKDGRPGYDPRDMLKLYMYGYLNKIRSSRRLRTECSRNVELMWLLGKLVPDFRCIADFRKDNAEAIKKVFREFTILCNKLNLIGKELIAIDGSKFKAVNSKDNNFTKGKLTDRITWIDEKISDYLSKLDENDNSETPISEKSVDEIKAEIEELESRKEKYIEYLQTLIETNQNQMSITDPEAKLMKNNGKLDVCYNTQTAVDSKHHIITEFVVTDHCNDLGLLEEVTKASKEILDVPTIELVADKGYRSVEEVKNCILNGDIPNVPVCDKQDDYSFGLMYKEEQITDEEKASTKRSDIEKCLSAGVVPDVLEGRVTIDVISEKESLKIIEETNSENKGTGIFVRNIEENYVVCPMGQILRKKSVNGGKIRYANKAACKKCLNPCTRSEYRTVDFKPEQIVIRGKKEKTITDKTVSKIKKVIVHFKPDEKTIKKRKCIVEHPFGTVKRWNDGSYLLMKGKVKATADLALSFLGYNLKRAINVLGVKKIMANL